MMKPQCCPFGRNKKYTLLRAAKNLDLQAYCTHNPPLAASIRHIQGTQRYMCYIHTVICTWRYDLPVLMYVLLSAP